jgi:hypothetical protein
MFSIALCLGEICSALPTMGGLVFTFKYWYPPRLPDPSLVLLGLQHGARLSGSRVSTIFNLFWPLTCLDWQFIALGSQLGCYTHLQ